MSMVMCCSGVRLYAVQPIQPQPTSNTQSLSHTQSLQPRIVDIELGPHAELSGTVVNGRGQRQARVHVSILEANGQRRETTTDQDGAFEVAKMKTGETVINVHDVKVRCRLWKHETAPPQAHQKLLFVTRREVHRGQREFGTLIQSNKFLLAFILAGAIAIPIAITSQSDDPAQPAS